MPFFRAPAQLRKIQQSSGCSGVAWSPLAPHTLATTSDAGPLYVYDTSDDAAARGAVLTQTLMGHT